MTFRQQIETSSSMDQAFLLENFTKESLFQNYEKQLNINHELNLKNEALERENKQLKFHIKRLELSLLVQEI